MNRGGKNNMSYKCFKCGKSLSNKEKLYEHLKKWHKNLTKKTKEYLTKKTKEYLRKQYDRGE